MATINATISPVRKNGLFKALRNLLSILLVIVITAVALEAALTVLDPLGVQYFRQLSFLEEYYVDGSGDYVLPPGIYHMKGWTATVENDFARAVPDDGTGCKVLFVGDSLTFGWGVNDDQTFVNRVARASGIQAQNAGTIGYNSENVAGALDVYTDYDLAVYLMVDNDAVKPLPNGGNPPQTGEHTFPPSGFYKPETPMTALYAAFFLKLEKPGENLMDRFYAAMDRITAHDNLVVFAFTSELTDAAKTRYMLEVLPWYSHVISRADPHPDAAGHQQIADAMLPHIRERLGDNCAAQ